MPIQEVIAELENAVLDATKLSRIAMGSGRSGHTAGTYAELANTLAEALSRAKQQ